MTINEMIAVLQEAARGKTIEALDKKNRLGYGWVEVQPDWDFSSWNYRVKPEPREWDAFVNEVGRLICKYEDFHETGNLTPIKVREVLP